MNARQLDIPCRCDPDPETHRDNHPTPDVTTCGECGRTWCGRCHGTHGPRCPFEADHDEAPSVADLCAEAAEAAPEYALAALREWAHKLTTRASTVDTHVEAAALFMALDNAGKISDQ